MGAKAIMSLKNPYVAEPIEPIRVMKKVISDGVETKEDDPDSRSRETGSCIKNMHLM